MKFEGHDRLQAGAASCPSSSCRRATSTRRRRSGRASTSCATPTAPRATSSGRGGRSASPTPSARSWTSPSPWTRTSGTTSGKITFTGNDHHPRQGDPARGLPERGRRLQHGSAEALHPAHQPARLLQAHGGRAGARGRAAWARTSIDVTFKVEEQNRNQFTFGGGVSGLEGHVHQRQLLDRELPGPGRDLPDLRPERRSARRTTRSRSPSPTSSTGPSPPASTSSSGSSPTRRSRTSSGYSRTTARGSASPPACPSGARLHPPVRELLVRGHQHRGPQRSSWASTANAP